MTDTGVSNSLPAAEENDDFVIDLEDDTIDFPSTGAKALGSALDEDPNDVMEVEEVEGVEEPQKAEKLEEVSPQAELINPHLRLDAIHLEGVENLSTEDIRRYARANSGYRSFKIEWINDSSLNLAYFNDGEAVDALKQLSSNPDTANYEITQLRPTKTYTDTDGVNLQARIAFTSDVKRKGARNRSRYYLIHGEPTAEDDYVTFGTEQQNVQELSERFDPPDITDDPTSWGDLQGPTIRNRPFRGRSALATTEISSSSLKDNSEDLFANKQLSQERDRQTLGMMSDIPENNYDLFPNIAFKSEEQKDGEDLFESKMKDDGLRLSRSRNRSRSPSNFESSRKDYRRRERPVYRSRNGSYSKEIRQYIEKDSQSENLREQGNRRIEYDDDGKWAKNDETSLESRLDFHSKKQWHSSSKGNNDDDFGARLGRTNEGGEKKKGKRRPRARDHF